MSTENVSKNSEQEEKEKLEAFLNEYKDLVKKYNIDFIAFPQFQPSQTTKGTWEVVIATQPFSLGQEPIPSPQEFISKE